MGDICRTPFDWIALIICGEAFTFWTSSLYCVLQPPATSYLLVPNVLLSTLFSNILNLCSSLSIKDQVARKNYGFVYFSL